MAQTVTQNIFTDLPSKKPSRKYNTKVQTTDPWEDALEKACKSISDRKQVKSKDSDDRFGQFIADRLREMAPAAKKGAMSGILQLLFQDSPSDSRFSLVWTIPFIKVLN